MELLWWGYPGPKFVVDRHNRPMASLYKDGRLFTAGNNRVMAVDAYNGVRLWDVAVPESLRVAIFRNCGWMAAASDYLYVAQRDNCVALDVETGVPALTLAAPQLIGGETRDWGYLAVDNNQLIGSGEKKTASWREPGLTTIYGQAYFDYKPLVTSDYLFGMNRSTGQQLWNYRNPSSVIINSSITVSDDAVYFVESRNAAAVSDADGRVTLAVLLSGSSEYLVKLNKTNGNQVWAVPVDLPYEHVLYVCYANSRIVTMGTRNSGTVYYEFRTYNPTNGSLYWSKSVNSGFTAGGNHGEQDQHPCIVGNTIYLRTHKLDLTSGNSLTFGITRSGCGTQSGSAAHLFARNSNPAMYDLNNNGAVTNLTSNTRPGCFINMIPAGGLVLIPESSSGCICDYTLQTSLAFKPQ